VINKKIVLALSLCVAGSMVPLQGAACTSGATLATYEALTTTGCEIGGLNFSSFFWTPTGANPHSTPTDTQVTLSTLLNSNGAGFLLTPTVAWSAGGGGFADGELKFVVKTVGGGSSITSLYQQIDGSVAGTGSFDDLAENYCFGTLGIPGCTPINNLESKIGPGGTCGPGATDGSGGCKNSVNFAAVSSISVRKDIRADATAGATGAAASITGVINQFGPAVPEPGTYLLSFIGLGLLFLGKHKYSRS
jgi:hypothetical protein